MLTLNHNPNQAPKRFSATVTIWRILPLVILTLFISSLATSVAVAQSGLMRLEHDDDNYSNDDHDFYRGGFIEQDPTLDVEIWTDNESGKYYVGDDVKIYFRTNRDAYVAVYNIDTDGRVNLIYPFDEHDSPYIEGGRIYRIPGPDADYDLLVNGPAGTENIQIVASRRPFPIPNWYEGSGLVADRDRYEFMDYINNTYFGCRSGCPRAIDNVSYVVKDWDNYYYRPVYYDPWPVWGSYGGLYVDYYWGSSIYVDGYYYGIAPLYLPRLGYGYHVVSVYDSYGYGWENSININGSAAIHLDNSIIRTTAGMNSRFRSVRRSGYRNPVRNGYAGVKITSKFRPRTTVRKTTTRTVTTRNGTVTRTKTQKTGSVVRGFNYKKNDRGTVTTRKTTTARKTTTRSSGKSAGGGKRLTAYKSAPERGGKARALRSNGSAASGRSGSASVRKSGKRSGSSSSRATRSGSSSSRGGAKALRSRPKKSGSSSRRSSAKKSRSRSGGSKSSVGSRRSSGRSGRSGASARGARSGGSRGGGRSAGHSGGSRRGGHKR